MGSRRTPAQETTGRSEQFQQLIDEFFLKLAIDERDRQRVYRLRHEVYCQEIGYTPPDCHSTGMELDPYDDSALHCLMVHRRSGIDAGCFRLILPPPDAEHTGLRLPLQEYAGTSLTHATLHPGRLPLDQICEISRFATARVFRNRPIRHETLADGPLTHAFSDHERRVFPLITISLFLATHALVDLVGRRHIFAMMAARLPRLLAMSGFRFTRVGDAIELHGQRNAFYIDNEVAKRERSRALATPYHLIRSQLACQLPLAIADREQLGLW
ncbi:PEP-CTERM/exosortase system-associated acyltransferase [Billgrantia sp. LNSP4103-1]|uniref:PEP-CTERM/exosortase system-associated acyltransferase n=1 Tax=Billgrantia sp. LNSP4103-1 TaxID=3410266 RepID=UPI00403FAFAC